MKRKILSIFVLALSVCFVLTSCDTSSLGKDTNSSSSTKEVSNKQTYTGSRSSLISQGYVPCKICNP